MRFLSLFSGIEAASVAWEPLGAKAVAFSEIEPFPCAVLAHHYPDVPNLGDVTKITEEQIASLGRIDLVCFGSPCQDLSVAGKRKGLIDASTGDVTRSGLFFSAMRIFHWARKHCGARFAMWENVAGAYSSNKGADFAAVVAEMAGLDDVGVPENGWGSEGCAVGDNGLLEWACMDAQWFGVAQRRRRVFAVLDTGAWEDREPVLLERNSLRRDTPPSREAGEGSARQAGASVTGDGKKRRELTKTTIRAPEVARCITTREGASYDYETTTMVVHGTQDPCTSSTTAFALGRNNGGENAVGVFYAGQGAKAGSIAYSNDVSPTLKAGNSGTNRAPTIHAPCPQGATAELGDEVGNCLRASGGGGDKAHVLAPVAFTVGNLARCAGPSPSSDTFPTLTVSKGCGLSDQQPSVMTAAMAVRRLTPVECERLQGFPDNWTLIPWRKKPAEECPDGPRYKALGNSWAVPNMRWIGRRIQRHLAGEL